MADTGDILLFRGRYFGCKLTRTFTNCHFGKYLIPNFVFIKQVFIDHVAMILKFESDPNEVYFVESTSNRGVSVSKWSSIKKFVGEFYE